jgi:hypothetical protein
VERERGSASAELSPLRTAKLQRRGTSTPFRSKARCSSSAFCASGKFEGRSLRRRRGAQYRRTRHRRGTGWREAALRRLPSSARQANKHIRPEGNDVLSPPGPVSPGLRSSLCVMSNAGIRRAPGVMTCLARLIQNRQAATGAENNNQSQCDPQRSLHGQTRESGPPKPATAPVNRGADEPAVNARPPGYHPITARLPPDYGPATGRRPGGFRSVATRPMDSG